MATMTEPTVTIISERTWCDWCLVDKYDNLYPHGIAARHRVSGAGEMDGYYCRRHARMAVDWWRENKDGES